MEPINLSERIADFFDAKKWIKLNRCRLEVFQAALDCFSRIVTQRDVQFTEQLDYNVCLSVYQMIRSNYPDTYPQYLRAVEHFMEFTFADSNIDLHWQERLLHYLAYNKYAFIFPDVSVNAFVLDNTEGITSASATSEAIDAILTEIKSSNYSGSTFWEMRRYLEMFFLFLDFHAYSYSRMLADRWLATVSEISQWGNATDMKLGHVGMIVKFS